MPSKVDIVNEALNMLGANTITSLTETTKTASLCNRFLDTEIDYLLRLHRWNSAVTDVAGLSNTGVTPTVGWLYEFLLPTDPYCLRVLRVEVDDVEVDFEVRGRNLYTDFSTGDLMYVSRVTDANKFDPLLYKVLVDLMAYRLAFPITRNRDLSNSMYQIYQQNLQDAMSVDSQERTPEQIASDDLLDARVR